jgi:hypothetical protein
MAENVLRAPPTGPIAARRGSVTIPQIAVAASSTGSGTFVFTGAQVGDNVMVNLRASAGNVSAPQAFVPAADHIELVFATGGAALTIATQTADVAILDF